MNEMKVNTSSGKTAPPDTKNLRGITESQVTELARRLIDAEEPCGESSTEDERIASAGIKVGISCMAAAVVSLLRGAAQ